MISTVFKCNAYRLLMAKAVIKHVTFEPLPQSRRSIGGRCDCALESLSTRTAMHYENGATIDSVLTCPSVPIIKFSLIYSEMS
jgi:hypothetical protein